MPQLLGTRAGKSPSEQPYEDGTACTAPSRNGRDQHDVWRNGCRTSTSRSVRVSAVTLRRTERLALQPAFALKDVHAARPRRIARGEAFFGVATKFPSSAETLGKLRPAQRFSASVRKMDVRRTFSLCNAAGCTASLLQLRGLQSC